MIGSIRNGNPSPTAIYPSMTGSTSSSFADVFTGVTATAASTSAGDKAPDGAHVARKADTAKAADLAGALAAFKKEASLTPAQRARRDVIEAMGLTEDAIKEMTPQQREAVEKKIAAEVTRRLRLDDANGQTGPAGSLSL